MCLHLCRHPKDSIGANLEQVQLIQGYQEGPCGDDGVHLAGGGDGQFQ